MRTMNWNDLKNQIEKMSVEERLQTVQVWGEDMPLQDVFFCKADEDMLYKEDWESCYPKSDCEPSDLDDPDVCVVMKKGTPYLYV